MPVCPATQQHASSQFNKHKNFLSYAEILLPSNIITPLPQIAQTAVTTGTRMFVNSLARERYPINYMYGFASEGFSYFLTSQMRHTSPSPYHSKLVRVCHDDSDYYSYTEIPIQCLGPDGTDYSLVQVTPPRPLPSVTQGTFSQPKKLAATINV